MPFAKRMAQLAGITQARDLSQPSRGLRARELHTHRACRPHLGSAAAMPHQGPARRPWWRGPSSATFMRSPESGSGCCKTSRPKASRETPEQREVLAHAAVGLMFEAIKPLGLLLARLPVGPDQPAVTAGANFQLPYRASFSAPTPPFGLAALRGAPRGAGPLRCWPASAGGRRCDRGGVWRA
jgi:hypothetical protein